MGITTEQYDTLLSRIKKKATPEKQIAKLLKSIPYTNMPKKKAKTVKRGKYNNKILETEDGRFHSQREYIRWRQLKLLNAKGAISDLTRQVPFRLQFNGVLIEKYIADYTYTERGNFVVEDCKGFRTKDYRRKRKWMKAFHGITIKET